MVDGKKFPSPRGDELQPYYINIEGHNIRFRPLAGMNCNSKTARYNPTVFCSLSQIMAKLQAIQPLYEQQAGQKMLLSWCEPVIQRGL